MRKSTPRVSLDDIRDRIIRQHKDVDILDINRENHNGNTKIIIKIKCKCGIIFKRELTHITSSHATCLCGHCAQKEASKNRKIRYNEKYNKMIEDLDITIINRPENLYARDKVEVEDNKTHLRFIWSIGEKIKHPLVWQPNGDNYKNFRYNLLKYANDKGYSCRDILTYKGSPKISIVCECGNLFSCDYKKFLDGQFRCIECSKHKSKYERLFETFLLDNNIEYISQYRTPLCKYKKPLAFDFFLSQQNILVEIQGEQHYKPTRFNNCSEIDAKLAFDEQQLRDTIKATFCKEHHIPLLVISCDEIKSGVFKQKTIDFIQTRTI